MNRKFKGIRKNYDLASIQEKLDLLSQHLGIPLKYIRHFPYNTELLRGNIENPIGFAQIPIGLVGPVNVGGVQATGNYFVPMATTEGALVLTYDLGARLLSAVPVRVEVIKKVIHITPMFIINSENALRDIKDYLSSNMGRIKAIAESDSSHLTLIGIDHECLNDMLLLRFYYDTCDAHGLNMINNATFNACLDIERKTNVSFFLRSHYSGIKHHSPLNEQIGYGFHIKASATIPGSVLRFLKVSARDLYDFTQRCIAVGNHAGIRSVNVHAANAISAVYLACGQDIADLSSSHVCKDRMALIRDQDLYWECEMPNLLVATVGGGTGLGTQKECLQIMECYGSDKAQKFAEILAATVFVGEYVTAASIVNRTYVEAHNKYGRNKRPKM